MIENYIKAFKNVEKMMIYFVISMLLAVVVSQYKAEIFWKIMLVCLEPSEIAFRYLGLRTPTILVINYTFNCFLMAMLGYYCKGQFIEHALIIFGFACGLSTAVFGIKERIVFVSAFVIYRLITLSFSANLGIVLAEEKEKILNENTLSKYNRELEYEELDKKLNRVDIIMNMIPVFAVYYVSWTVISRLY